MKFTTATAAALSFSSVALASKPFYLIVDSANSTYNGKALSAGHEGAGIEGLLALNNLTVAKKNPQYYTYHFEPVDNTTTSSGALVWTIPGDNITEAEPLTLYSNPITNVALALFEPGDNDQDVSFDSSGKMYLTSALDDTVTPPTDENNIDLYRWNICNYDFEGYIYPALCWVYGIYPAQNPSCQAVNVTRVYS